MQQRKGSHMPKDALSFSFCDSAPQISVLQPVLLSKSEYEVGSSCHPVSLPHQSYIKLSCCTEAADSSVFENALLEENLYFLSFNQFCQSGYLQAGQCLHPGNCFSWYLKVIAYCSWRLHLFVNTDLLTAAFCFFNTVWNCSWKLRYIHSKAGAFGWLDLEWADGLSHPRHADW